MNQLLFPFKSKQSLSHCEARELTRKFLDGATEPADERRLYRYYAMKNIASDLEAYREMFAWYNALESSNPDKRSIRGGHVRRFAVAAAITVLIVLGGVFVSTNVSTQNSSETRMYAGSYIIRNGKKITDVRSILPELQQADRFVDSTLLALNHISPEDPELRVLSDAIKNIPDPEVKAMLLADLHN